MWTMWSQICRTLYSAQNSLCRPGELFSDLVKTSTDSNNTRTNTVPVQIPRVQSSGKGTFVYNSAKNWQIFRKNLKTIKPQKPFKLKPFLKKQ